MKGTMGISKTYLPTKVAMCKEWEHKGLVMEANLGNEATKEGGRHEVTGAMGHHEVITSTGVEFEAKDHQEEITTIEAVTEATMVVETRAIKILVTEMGPSEEVTKVETETRREVECGGVQTESPTKTEDIMTIINALIQALKMVLYL